jgi:hypothetical protein
MYTFLILLSLLVEPWISNHPAKCGSFGRADFTTNTTIIYKQEKGCGTFDDLVDELK